MRFLFGSKLAPLVVGSLIVFAFGWNSSSTHTRAAAKPGGAEYTGQFQPALIGNLDDLHRVIFKPVDDLSKLQFETPLPEGAKPTGARLYHPQQDRDSLLALMIEIEGEDPQIYVDLDQNKTLSNAELFTFKREEEDNPYIWNVDVGIPLEGKLFTSFPIRIQYLKNVEADDMRPQDRYLRQSKTAFARGKIDVKGRPILVQYGYNAQTKKVSPTSGPLGLDANGDGTIETDKLSPEATEAQEETVVFRAGDLYLSTKMADVDKNQIVLRENKASDYKRIEFVMGGELPDYSFSDTSGKKHKFSEFRGKYLLVDFWGFWCPACREQLPYLIEAYKRFQPRNFEILGMNSDTDMTTSDLDANLKRNHIEWTQATILSIKDTIINMRIGSWPTTVLLDPQGKIISLDQTEAGQPSLRGGELLKTLDKVLPLL